MHRLMAGLLGRASAPRAVRQLISSCRDVLSERGEVAGVRLASEALLKYQALSEPDRAAFFDLLIHDFSPDPAEAGLAGDAYRNEQSAENSARLQRAAEPPRQELFRRLNLAPGGTAQLIGIRRHLLEQVETFPQWEPIEADLAHLLFSWFNRGFLILQRIDWRTPAIILEKLIQYEAVHQIQGWRDLRRRLEADRRCYAFFHPALPDEPIIFIEVALTRGMSRKVQPLLDPDSAVSDPATANCAIFYSITNCQEGLRGVPFGSFLIKRVAEDLGRDHPRIRTFATISPVPGFQQWLDNLPEETQTELSSLCAYYLVHAKRGKEPLDPVARFHLRNGARLDRVNPLGDTSPGGLKQSAGFMVNYVYDLPDVERNHELYTGEFRVSASREVEKLARLCRLAS
jgi:malonyl-CoA decarboxylase